MQLDEMPMNLSGKIDKKALPEAVMMEEEIIPAENETQEKILSIVKDVLGDVPVGITSDIFALGLSSVGCIRLCALLSEEYKKVAYSGFLVHVSEMIPGLTGGKYTDLDFDEAGNLVVNQDGYQVKMDTLPRRDIDRIALAVKLAAAKYLATEALPLVIDGTGELRAEEPRKALINYLISMNEEQIIILTDDTKLAAAFTGSGVQANVINLQG